MAATGMRFRVLLLLLFVTIAGTGCKGFMWGLNTQGQLGDGTVGNESTPRPVGPGPGWSSVDTGDGGGFSCGIRDTGAFARVWCWGVNYYGYLGDGTINYSALPVQAIGMTQAHQVTTGGGFACAIRSATHTGGQLWCWGFNNTGEVGDGTIVEKHVPTRIGTTSDWLSVSAGGAHTCGIRNGGELYCWGYNNVGQLGDGTGTDRYVPTRVGTGTDWLSVNAGDYHTCGVRTGGQLWCWGQNFDGELGNGTVGSGSAVPLRVGTGSDWSSVAAGLSHTCGIRTAGHLFCWGKNAAGEIGDGTIMRRLVPTRVGTGTDWVSVSSSNAHTCGTRGTGSLYCWGANGDGQIGDGTTTGKTVPTHIGSGTNWHSVATAGFSACGARGSDLWCWGLGGLGDGTNVVRYSPVQVGVPTNWSQLSAGGDHTCGISQEKSLWCWGDNSNGQLGTGTTPTDSATPTRIGVNDDWTDISAGTFHTCAIENNVSLWCWGWNFTGQLGDGGTTEKPTPVQIAPGGTNWTSVSAGHDNTCAIRTGQLWCWGYNSSGQVGDGSTSERHLPTRIGTDADWSSVALGSGFDACGIKAGGQLWCWGYNFDGEVGDGSSTNRTSPVRIGADADWTAVALGGFHACGVRAGQLYCWGLDASGQLGDGTTSTRFAPLRIGTDTNWGSLGLGGAFSCAIKAGGQLWCWGQNTSGQLGDSTTSDHGTPERIGTAANWSSIDAGFNHTAGIQRTS